MADVDAVRHLASEHDLEFVDLDDYGVDPAASEILPAELARQHHMVAIKRKFGTPVIAIADPSDDEGHDAIREAIGRDFISVVASEEQITGYLDRLFGPASEGGRRSGGARKGRKQADEPAGAPRTGEAEALGRSLVELDMEELGAAEQGSNGKANGLASKGLVDAPGLGAQDELSAVLESLTDAPGAADPVDLVSDLDEPPQMDHDGVDDENNGAGSDSDSEDLADLVAEAVATYQEQHGEVADDGDVDGEPETASFPMLAKALVAGERVSVDDMRSALEESQLSGQNVAHVLMARGLVTEADLMWGMAQEMGLEFVDLDMVGHQLHGGGDAPRGHCPSPQRHRHRRGGGEAGCRCLQPHGRVRHGRPPHHHRAPVQGRRGHPFPDHVLHRQGL